MARKAMITCSVVVSGATTEAQAYQAACSRLGNLETTLILFDSDAALGQVEAMDDATAYRRDLTHAIMLAKTAKVQAYNDWRIRLEITE